MINREKIEDIALWTFVALALIAITVALFCGPSGPGPGINAEISQPAVIMETLDPSLEVFAPLWKAEIGRRFPHAIGILVHLYA